MNASSDSRRIVGALRFLADLAAMAAECVETELWNDELTARRRQRGGAITIGEAYAEDLQVKAL